jgi:hypothetical protein
VTCQRKYSADPWGDAHAMMTSVEASKVNHVVTKVSWIVFLSATGTSQALMATVIPSAKAPAARSEHTPARTLLRAINSTLLRSPISAHHEKVLIDECIPVREEALDDEGGERD